jgi:hypothetical protein
MVPLLLHSGMSMKKSVFVAPLVGLSLSIFKNSSYDIIHLHLQVLGLEPFSKDNRLPLCRSPYAQHVICMYLWLLRYLDWLTCII